MSDDAATWPARRRQVLRVAAGVGIATGAYGLSFGAIAVAAGLTVTQTCALSVLAFTGGSQFALVGVLGAGGNALAGAASAVLLGVRNVFYGVRMSTLLRVRGLRRLVAAQLVIDEATAVATAQPDTRSSRLGFWATGAAVFVLWNAATLAGALAGSALGDPQALGLDAAVPAAFVALLWPRLRGPDGRTARMVAAAAVVVALAAALVLPAGLPVLLAGLPALWAGLRGRGSAGATTSEATDFERPAEGSTP